MIKIGTLIKPHGLKGEVKILPDFDGKEFYQQIKSAKILLHDENVLVNINSVKTVNKYIVLGFEEIHSIDEITRYLHCDIYIDDVDLPENDDYYDFEIIGLEAFDEETGNRLGVVTDILKMKAGEIIEIGGDREILVPFRDEFVTKIDIDENKLIVHLIEGM